VSSGHDEARERLRQLNNEKLLTANKLKVSLSLFLSLCMCSFVLLFTSICVCVCCVTSLQAKVYQNYPKFIHTSREIARTYPSGLVHIPVLHKIL
jgi:hypothetical protein